MLRRCICNCILVVTGCALLMAAGCGGDAGESPPPPTGVPSERPEGRLTVCVEASEGLADIEDDALRRLTLALSEVRADRRWANYYPSPEEPVLDAGCPAEPATVGVNWVEAPGYYRVYVFVVPQVTYDAAFAQETLRTGTGSSGVAAATGLFVTPEDLCDGGRLVALLMHAVGFDHAPLPADTPAPEGASATPSM